MDLSLPTVIGITTPGNKTLFRRGRIGSSSGKTCLFTFSSSSAVIKGINSASFSIPENPKKSTSFILLIFALFSATVCQLVVKAALIY